MSSLLEDYDKYSKLYRECPERASVCDAGVSRGYVRVDECPVGWVATSAGNCALLLTCDTGSRAGFRPPPPTVTAAPHSNANARPSALYVRQRRHSVRVVRQAGPSGRTLDRTCSWEAAEATCAEVGGHLFSLEPDHLTTTGGQSRDITLSPPTHQSLPPRSPPLQTEKEAQMSREDEGVWLAEFLKSSVREHQLALRPVFIGLGVRFCATSVRYAYFMTS